MQLSEINLETIRRPSSSRQASWWARVCFAMSHRWFCRVQSHHWRAKRSADNLRLVCSCCWTTSFKKTNSNKHRTSRVADLNDSENTHSFQPTNTHHTRGFPYSSFQWFSAVSVLSVEWTLMPHLRCDVARLEWSLGICIPHKHSRNWMAGPQAMSWKTLTCLRYVTKRCCCLWLHGEVLS